MPARPYRVAPLPPDFYTWSFPGGPLRINIPHSLISRLRSEIDEHRRRHPDPSDGEVGGVLLGREGDYPDTLEIEDYTFLPSATTDGQYHWNAAAFKQIGRPNDETRSVGFFRTELGETLTLRDDELVAVRRDFPDRTNVVLMLRSSPEECSAGFLFWDGDVFTPFSFMTFPFDVETLKREASERFADPVEEGEAPATPVEIASSTVVYEPVAEPAVEPAKEALPRVREDGPMRLSTTTLWLLGAALFGLTAGVVILGLYYLLPSLQSARVADALRLDVMAQAEGIHVRWNPQSAVVKQARDGRLIVVDGDRQAQILPLNKEQLKGGHVYFEPATERTEFQLEVSDESGHTVKESVIVVSSKAPIPASQAPVTAPGVPAAPVGRRAPGR